MATRTPSSARRPGRPRKPAATRIAAAPETPRRPGRPRKNAVAAQAVIEQPRRRGRPPRVVAEAVAIEAPAKRRGRPPRSAQPIATTAAAPATTRRGRTAAAKAAAAPLRARAANAASETPRRGRRPAAASAAPAEAPKRRGRRAATVTAAPAPAGRRKRVAPNNEWWRGGVIYQIYPRSYQDSNGDGIGDLQGITRRLDHVASLGVDAIWLSPFFKSPMKDFGYDVSDYRDVDPLFGTLADFKALLNRAHELGLKVMIDQVLSHTSDQHPWFAQSRQNRTNARADWYVWADAKKDGTPPNNWLSVFGGSAWQWDTRRKQYYLHNFLTSQPDLNFHNPRVQDAVLADMKFWLDLGVDGFRLDTVNFYVHDKTLRDNPSRAPRKGEAAGVVEANPYTWQWHLHDKTQPENIAFLKRMRDLLDKYPNTTMVGEVGAEHGDLEIMAEYTSGGDKLHMAYSFELLRSAHSAPHLHQLLASFGRIVGDGWPSWPIANHDCKRVVTRWGAPEGNEAAQAVARLAAAMQLTLRGSPCIYQGDELGLPEADLRFEDLQDPFGITMWPEAGGRDGCRTPFPWEKQSAQAGFSTADKSWLPVPAEHRALAADQQEKNRGSMLNYYRQLLAWRKQHPALIKGDMKLLPKHEQVLAYERKFEGDTLLCVFNFSGRKASFELPRAWKNGVIDTGSGVSGAGINRLGRVVLTPWGGAIIARAR